MNRKFIATPAFDRYWKGLGLGDEEQRGLEKMLLENPRAGVVIPGTAGARKVRIEFGGKGKRGGARVIYVDILEHGNIFFLAAYAKGAQENISEADKKAIANLIGLLKTELAKKGR
ncbi:type II toxin-antitoxin system RelE/ParE family toxin [Christensenellaceae bacterium OttesenSCG-928-K19]|nr:type II toxin-antitoxin system RelE/ParE family toxin [Christensenellaceae bacterium OttesenSCG-928-K19]